MEQGWVGVRNLTRKVQVELLNKANHFSPELRFLFLVENWPAVSKFLLSFLVVGGKKKQDNMLECILIGVIEETSTELHSFNVWRRIVTLRNPSINCTFQTE